MKFFRKNSYRLLIIVFLLGITLGYFGNQSFTTARDKSVEEGSYAQKRDVFQSVVNYVRDLYVDKEKLSPKSLYYGAINGLLDSLDDPHTRLMEPDRYKDMQTEIDQEFGGLGIYITIRNGDLTIIAPMQGTPAFKAGLQPGDVIAAINGNSTKDMTKTEEAVDKLRGPKGSEVDLTIRRRGQTFEVTVTRGEIPIQSVFSSMLDEENNIGYLKITTFGEKTHQEVSEALKNLHDDGMQSLVLDVRNNPGGSLRSAYKVANKWISKGRIVYTRGRTSQQNKNYPAVKDGTESSYPLAILGNQGSASGSEILIGALKDHERAVVMGDTTFGKGLVQSVFPLQDGSALALTTARYFTPDGHMIQDQGIPPHIHLSQDFPDTEVQRQLARLNQGDTVLRFVKDHETLDQETIDTFVETLRDQGFSLDRRYILNIIRRRQYAMEGKRMAASPNTDPQLRKSLEKFRTLIRGERSKSLDPDVTFTW
ncbi:MAG: S41 family peptidase [bacterium]